MKARFCLGLVALGAASGCMLLPRGFVDQEQRSREAAAVYLEPLAQRPIPPIEQEPSLDGLVEYAWRNNGEIRAALLEWIAAVERVREQAGYPNTNLHLALEAMWRGGDASWNDVTIGLGNDPMTNLALPIKVAAAARLALEEARAAEAKFWAKRLALREQVASRFADWVATTRRLALARERAEWLARGEQSLAASLEAGQTSQDAWIRARAELLLARNDVADLVAQEAVLRSELNALLGRSPGAPLGAAAAPPPLVAPNRSWEALYQELMAGNAELAGLRAEVAARQRALELARLQFLPDVNPMLAFTGEPSRTIGAALVLPLTWRRLQAQVANLDALLRASRAMLEQEQTTKTSELATALVLVENLDRQRRLWEEQLLPDFRLVCATLRQAYEANTVPLAEWARAEAARTEVEARLEEIIALREQQVARADRLLGRFGPGGAPARAEVAHGN
ncbi:MAG: hypothetical protein KatS3mg077_0622 [Candidatus Binatia bacterium]|nr:MAG: hypothetical protein KatS3mg077_0622 [Candidatus Binatia bacterium]